MLSCINAWTAPGGATFEEFFAAVAEAGFDGVELNIDSAGAHSLTLATTDAELAAIKSKAESAGVRVTSISTSLWGDLLSRDDLSPARELLDAQLRFAEALGADGILVVPGGIGKYSIVEAHHRCLAALRSMSDIIAAHDVWVGLENVWNGFFMSPIDMARFIDDVNEGESRPRVGAYFDIGNVMVFSQPEYWIEALGARIKKVHVKDFVRSHGVFTGWFCNLLEGSVNWRAVGAALKAAGYDSSLTAELGYMEPCEYLYDITNRAQRIIIDYCK
jgi:hexulose-6-phosphate isomerase